MSAGALGDLNHLLRDFRVNVVKPIDPELLDLLFALNTRARHRPAVPRDLRLPHAGNQRDAAGAGRVAQRRREPQPAHRGARRSTSACRASGSSTCATRRKALQIGGVGYYPASDFVHVDTGRVRYW